jgi:hypothetical protein
LFSGNTVDNRTRFKDEAKERELSIKDSEKTPRNDDERKLNHTENEREINHTGKRCTITCFNPDGSPLQGTYYYYYIIVSALGASFERKLTNYIVLLLANFLARESFCVTYIFYSTVVFRLPYLRLSLFLKSFYVFREKFYSEFSRSIPWKEGYQ